LREWEQGDAVAAPPIMYFADPRRPVWISTHAYTADSDGPEVVVADEVHTPHYGLVVTQTCDIAEEDSPLPRRPWVQIAPVFRISQKGFRKRLLQGKGAQYWIHLPLLGEADEVYAADLRIEIPVEKGWLASQERIVVFPDELSKRSVGPRVAALRSRPAFSREFNSLVHTPLRDALEAIRDDDDPFEQVFLEQLLEVNVRVDSYLNPRLVQIVAITTDPPHADLVAWFEQWVDDHRPVASEHGMTLLAVDVSSILSLSVPEYKELTPLWRRQ
jgi:hypothetical protein